MVDDDDDDYDDDDNGDDDDDAKRKMQNMVNAVGMFMLVFTYIKLLA